MKAIATATFVLHIENHAKIFINIPWCISLACKYDLEVMFQQAEVRPESFAGDLEAVFPSPSLNSVGHKEDPEFDQ